MKFTILFITALTSFNLYSLLTKNIVYADDEPQKIYEKYKNVEKLSKKEYENLVRITRENFNRKNLTYFFKIIESSHYFNSELGLELTNGSRLSLDEKSNYFASGKAFKDLIDPNETTLSQIEIAEKSWLDGLTLPYDRYGEIEFFSIGYGKNMSIHERQYSFFNELKKTFNLEKHPERTSSYIRAWIEVCATNGDLGDTSTAILKEFDKNPSWIAESLPELKKLYFNNLEKSLNSDAPWYADSSRLTRFSRIGDKKEIDYFYYSGQPAIEKLKGYKNWVRFQKKYQLDFQNNITKDSNTFITFLNRHAKYRTFINLIKEPEIQREIEESKNLYFQLLEIKQKNLPYGNTFIVNMPIVDLIKKFNPRLGLALEINSRVYPNVIKCINRYNREFSKTIE